MSNEADHMKKGTIVYGVCDNSMLGPIKRGQRATVIRSYWSNGEGVLDVKLDDGTIIKHTPDMLWVSHFTTYSGFIFGVDREVTIVYNPFDAELRKMGVRKALTEFAGHEDWMYDEGTNVEFNDMNLDLLLNENVHIIAYM